MIKALAPLGLLAVVVAAGSAAAKTCPSGQIYRVSLHVCAAKSANLRYYHGGQVAARGAHVTTLARHVDEAPVQRTPPTRPEVASLRGSERPEAVSATAARPAAPIPAADPAPAPSADPIPAATAPFGLLPSVSSFR